jgi:hypothetical protein
MVLGMLLSTTAIVLAGNLDPGNGPTEPGSQMYTLDGADHELPLASSTATLGENVGWIHFRWTAWVSTSIAASRRPARGFN